MRCILVSFFPADLRIGRWLLDFFPDAETTKCIANILPEEQEVDMKPRPRSLLTFPVSTLDGQHLPSHSIHHAPLIIFTHPMEKRPLSVCLRSSPVPLLLAVSVAKIVGKFIHKNNQCSSRVKIKNMGDFLAPAVRSWLLSGDSV